MLGNPVDLETDFDEGNSAATASEAISGLLERDVDAVIGPASSTVALATLDELEDRLTCSPTATAIALDDYPAELFFRTAPSDSLQAEAIAQYAERTGARTAAVAYLDDAYGRPFEAATTEALRSRGLAVLEPVAFAADEESLTDQAAAISESDVGVVIVIGNGEHGMRMLAALSEVAGLFPGGEPPEIIVNDAIRRPPSTQLVQALSPVVREQVTGVSPLAALGNQPDEPAGPFATNAFDCVNLIALSAAQANSDSPRQMEDQMSEVEQRRDAMPLVRGVQPAARRTATSTTTGPGGVVEIGPDGDPARAWFDLFDFNEQGVDVSRVAPMMVPAEASASRARRARPRHRPGSRRRSGRTRRTAPSPCRSASCTRRP